MNKYSYIITKSIFPDDKNWIKTQIQKKQPCHKWKFRLLDADGNVCFMGLATHKDRFDPLDEIGEGCTDIQYFNSKKKKWETL